MMSSYAYLILVVIVLASLVFAASLAWKYMRNLLTSRPPPVIDASGEDVKKELDSVVEQRREASEELQEIVRKILAENDRLRRFHVGGE